MIYSKYTKLTKLISISSINGSITNTNFFPRILVNINIIEIFTCAFFNTGTTLVNAAEVDNLLKQLILRIAARDEENSQQSTTSGWGTTHFTGPDPDKG